MTYLSSVLIFIAGALLALQYLALYVVIDAKDKDLMKYKSLMVFWRIPFGLYVFLVLVIITDFLNKLIKLK